MSIEDKVAKARFYTGDHHAGMRFSFQLWPMYRSPPKAAVELVDRLEKLLDEACTDDEKRLLETWSCKPVLYAPSGKPLPAPPDDEVAEALKACCRRALSLAPWPAEIYEHWNYNDGGHIGISVVVRKV